MGMIIVRYVEVNSIYKVKEGNHHLQPPAVTAQPPAVCRQPPSHLKFDFSYFQFVYK